MELDDIESEIWACEHEAIPSLSDEDLLEACNAVELAMGELRSTEWRAYQQAQAAKLLAQADVVLKNIESEITKRGLVRDTALTEERRKERLETGISTQIEYL